MKHVLLVKIMNHWFVPICVENANQAVFDTIEEARYEAKKQLEYHGKRAFKEMVIGSMEVTEYPLNEESEKKND